MEARFTEYRARVLEKRRRERGPYVAPADREKAARRQAREDKVFNIGLALAICPDATLAEIEKSNEELANPPPVDEALFAREVEKIRAELAAEKLRPPKKRRRRP